MEPTVKNPKEPSSGQVACSNNSNNNNNADMSFNLIVTSGTSLLVNL